MFFKVQDLERKKIHFDTTFAPGEIQFVEDNLRQTGPFAARGTAELLNNTLGEIRVRGRISGHVEANCDRCLETATFPVDSNFDSFYRPASTAPEHEEVRIDEGEAEIAFYEGDGVRLEDVLREHILLQLPMQLVCSEACKGICPQCGQNLNKGACDCRRERIDERWSALKNL
jgi:uncharacterized protein